jgi:hypothetical protein
MGHRTLQRTPWSQVRGRDGPGTKSVNYYSLYLFSLYQSYGLITRLLISKSAIFVFFFWNSKSSLVSRHAHAFVTLLTRCLHESIVNLKLKWGTQHMLHTLFLACNGVLMAYKTCLVRSNVLITWHFFNFNKHHRTSKDARDVMDAMWSRLDAWSKNVIGGPPFLRGKVVVVA